MNGMDAATDALAVARLTRLLQEDRVPLGPLRDKVMMRWGHHPATEVLECPWCASVHLGALVVFLRWQFPRVWPYAARALAASQVTGMAAEIGH